MLRTPLKPEDLVVDPDSRTLRMRLSSGYQVDFGSGRYGILLALAKGATQAGTLSWTRDTLAKATKSYVNDPSRCSASNASATEAKDNCFTNALPHLIASGHIFKRTSVVYDANRGAVRKFGDTLTVTGVGLRDGRAIFQHHVAIGRHYDKLIASGMRSEKYYGKRDGPDAGSPLPLLLRGGRGPLSKTVDMPPSIASQFSMGAGAGAGARRTAVATNRLPEEVVIIIYHLFAHTRLNLRSMLTIDLLRVFPIGETFRVLRKIIKAAIVGDEDGASTLHSAGVTEAHIEGIRQKCLITENVMPTGGWKSNDETARVAYNKPPEEETVFLDDERDSENMQRALAASLSPEYMSGAGVGGGAVSTASTKYPRENQAFAPPALEDDDDDSERGFVRSRTKKKTTKREPQKKASATRPGSPPLPQAPPPTAPLRAAPPIRTAPQVLHPQVIVIDDDSVIEISGSDSASDIVIECACD